MTVCSRVWVYLPGSSLNSSSRVGFQVPLKGGYKYFFARHFYLIGDLGYSIFRYYYNDGNGNIVSSFGGGFTFGPSPGSRFGVMDIGILYENTQLAPGTISSFGLRLGFDF